ncbi:Selenoprotein O and cysteine-containing homologs [hydrothermal vent metagenome]|uniref:Selenoprotein O and cysteine-containing homologs n=1 Tax=hydrothermal vent metagenome TaxID=652676 RepID=A0A3B0WHT2_9ZZZZ
MKPAVREFIMSEAMHALGVPTTRCLAVVTTGESVYRQTSTAGAVVTRVASSHIRVGTFEYFAAKQMTAEIKVLADLTLARHFPEIDQSDDSKYFDLLSQVIDNQIILTTEWMRIGFIHGVMNTDNTLLSGETIDYGPCAMMGIYDPATVFSSIDRNGRYAYGNQAKIAQWNMTRLAERLLTLIHGDEKQAIDLVMPLLQEFPEKYKQAFNHMMANKLGFQQASTEVTKLQQSLLDLMFKYKLDYTQTFVQLQNTLASAETDQVLAHETFNSNLGNLNIGDWHQIWTSLLQQAKIKSDDAKQLMGQHNPLVIPRNHHVEQVLEQVESDLSAAAVKPFLTVLQSPYSPTKNTRLYQDANDDLNYQTFCGT